MNPKRGRLSLVAFCLISGYVHALCVGVNVFVHLTSSVIYVTLFLDQSSHRRYKGTHISGLVVIAHNRELSLYKPVQLASSLSAVTLNPAPAATS